MKTGRIGTRKCSKRAISAGGTKNKIKLDDQLIEHGRQTSKYPSLNSKSPP